MSPIHQDARSEVRLRDLLRNSGDLILLLAIDRTVRFVSDSVTASWGYEPSEVLGRDIAEFLTSRPNGRATPSQIMKALGTTSASLSRARASARQHGGDSEQPEEQNGASAYVLVCRCRAGEKPDREQPDRQ